MKELEDLLKHAGVRKALIVDDAFDIVPLASDLVQDDELWTRMFDDLSEDESKKLEQLYPEYSDTDATQLRESNHFVKILWDNREILNSRPVNALFTRREDARLTDLKFLNALTEFLEMLGLECIPSGRNFVDKAADVQLIFVDLFLNSAQRAEDIQHSVNGIKSVIESRRNDHPLVVLMSRNDRLPAIRAHFQEQTKLFESNFRIIKKLELTDQAAVARLLIRLATHFDDSKKLLTFVNAWEDGLAAAQQETMKLIRKIGLVDIARIHQLLLAAEGEPAGSYLVDIFDKLLQHEIERVQPIIDAAIAMNTLIMDDYPPPFVPEEKDLQDLVHRCLFQNRARLGLPGSIGSKLAFGDVLRRKPPPSAPVQEAAIQPFENLLAEVSTNMVLTVLTPACDLQRMGTRRILLLTGELKQLSAKDWTYKDEGVRTPVLELRNGERFWIKWDLKYIETLSHAELDHLLSPEHGSFEHVARLRESHALELQQKLLSSLGRIGLVAPMPATFNMHIEAFVPNDTGELIQANIPALDETGVCFTGRGKDPKNVEERFLLTEHACEAIWTFVDSIDLGNVKNGNLRKLLSELRSTPDLLKALEQGLTLPSIANPTNFKEIVTPAGKVVGLVKRSRINPGEVLPTKLIPKAAIVLAIFDSSAPAEVPDQEVDEPPLALAAEATIPTAPSGSKTA